MTKNEMKCLTSAGIHFLLCKREEAVKEAIAAVNEVRSEIARRANAKVRAKQEASGTKQIRVSSLKIGMELKVPGGYQKIMHLRRPESGWARHREKRIVLANGKYRTRSFSDMVTVKA